MLVGLRKKIIRGPYKGYEGIIKQINNNKVKFELSAQCKVVNIPLNYLNLKINQ